MLKHLLVTALAALALPATASAATIVIDDFITEQFVASKPMTGQTAYSEAVAPSAQQVGGYREMRVINNQNRRSGTTMESGGGYLDFSNATRSTGRGILTWDGKASVGLGGLDVTDRGTNDAVFFALIFADANVAMTFSMTDTSGRTSTYSTTLMESLGQQEINFGFAAFAGSANFKSVNSISLTLEGLSPAVDATIDKIFFGSTVVPAPVPLPASASLLLSVLAGMAMTARRRRSRL